MPRVKLSEFRAKQLLFKTLQQKYAGISVDLAQKDFPKQVDKLPASGLYVVKVDQAIKKRGKAGLVKIKRTKNQVLSDLKKFKRGGYRFALVEKFVEHQADDERYLALVRKDETVQLGYSPHGGIDIELNADSLRWSDLDRLSSTPLDQKFIDDIHQLFIDSHMTLLEINPLLIRDNKYMPLDAAVEVDSAAAFFVGGAWTEDDVREADRQPHPAELAIKQLNSKSPASLSCKILNPDGSLFLLLSGGGASVVVADELSQRGYHQAIANYGEYSGNPSEDETYIYTKEILNLMLKSKARKKVLIIAGGVANFTDVAKTFAGIIRAMREAASEISRQKIEVIVRRGGPNQQAGLSAMAQFLDNIGVKHSV
jgi:succinyl-CoA synthetase beta subunit